MLLLFYLNRIILFFLFFFFNDTATTEIYTLSLHDALPICGAQKLQPLCGQPEFQESLCGILESRDSAVAPGKDRKEHTSELQSQSNLVCRLLLEKKKNT